MNGLVEVSRETCEGCIFSGIYYGFYPQRVKMDIGCEYISITKHSRLYGPGGVKKHDPKYCDCYIPKRQKK